MREIMISWCCLLLLSSFAHAGEIRDDFGDGSDDGWKVASGDWEVLEGTYVQLGGGMNVGGVPRTIIQSPWAFTDGTIEVTITFDRKSNGAEIPAILYRLTDEDNGYAFRLHSDSLEVGRFLDGQYSDIRGDAFPIDIEKPCKIKLEIAGIFTKVYYNDVLKSRIGDPNAKGTEKGKIGLAVFDADTPIYFDDIIIQGDGIFSFPPFLQDVDPGGKLPSFWGRIKES